MTTERIDRTGVGLRSERGPILLAVMLSIGLVAIDATILATAVPSVVKDLGGFSSFPWLFSVYLLAQAVSVPISRATAPTRSPASTGTSPNAGPAHSPRVPASPWPWTSTPA